MPTQKVAFAFSAFIAPVSTPQCITDTLSAPDPNATAEPISRMIPPRSLFPNAHGTLRNLRRRLSGDAKSMVSNANVAHSGQDFERSSPLPLEFATDAAGEGVGLVVAAKFAGVFH